MLLNYYYLLMRTYFLDFSYSLELCIGIYAFEAVDSSNLYLPSSGKKYSVFVLLMSVTFPTSSGYIHILHTSHGRVLKVSCVSWFLEFTSLVIGNLSSFFSRRWHYSSSLWFLTCPLTLASSVSYLSPRACSQSITCKYTQGANLRVGTDVGLALGFLGVLMDPERRFWDVLMCGLPA